MIERQGDDVTSGSYLNQSNRIQDSIWLIDSAISINLSDGDLKRNLALISLIGTSVTHSRTLTFMQILADSLGSFSYLEVSYILKVQSPSTLYKVDSTYNSFQSQPPGYHLGQMLHSFLYKQIPILLKVVFLSVSRYCSERRFLCPDNP